MTEQQKETIRQAQQAFVAPLDAGVDEDRLIDAVFETTMGRDSGDLDDTLTKMFEADIRWYRKLCDEEAVADVKAPLENTRA